MLWKLTDVRRKLQEARAKDGLEMCSGPFYSSQHGYKMMASIFLNGNGIGEGNHASIYIKILPGEYDALLKWPFTHSVTFTLYDQNPDAEKSVNVVESFRPDPNWQNFKRAPSTDSPDSLGFGFPMFVPHQILLHPARNYIRDDVIFLRIAVDSK
jgi:TNF receptor-associated factor 4